MIKLLTGYLDVVFHIQSFWRNANQIWSIIPGRVKQYIREQLKVKKQQGQKICVVEAALF